MKKKLEVVFKADVSVDQIQAVTEILGGFEEVESVQEVVDKASEEYMPTPAFDDEVVEKEPDPDLELDPEPNMTPEEDDGTRPSPPEEKPQQMYKPHEGQPVAPVEKINDDPVAMMSDFGVNGTPVIETDETAKAEGTPVSDAGIVAPEGAEERVMETEIQLEEEAAEEKLDETDSWRMGETPVDPNGTWGTSDDDDGWDN